MNKKCVFIIVYFGKFNNYFPLLLKSCKFNKEYDWIIVTDDKEEYDYPINCRKVEMNLDDFNILASKKIGININIKEPYKLCDFKPAYGLIFEEYICDYDYWGHCDCDVVFGNMNRFLPLIFNGNYDKIFASGHLTIYKNNRLNNRIFMNKLDGQDEYKKVFKSPKICVFDEDCNINGFYRKNVHSIFLNQGKKIYNVDMSLNLKTKSSKLINVLYDGERRNFYPLPYKKEKFYWDKGELFSIDINGNRTDYLYAHFQMRKMRFNKKNMNSNTFEILPDRFRKKEKVKEKLNIIDYLLIGFPYLYWYDYLIRKIKGKVRKNG